MSQENEQNPPGLTKPNNVFEMQNNVSDELNEFQKNYSRYIRCQNPDTRDLVEPSCDIGNDESFQHLTSAYKNLYSSLDELKKVYDEQIKDGATNEEYELNEKELEDYYNEVRTMRKDLDEKLFYIQNQSDIQTAPVYRRLNSQILINTLLLILLVYLIYVCIFDIF